MKLTEAQVIEKAKEYAEKNYSNGFDTFVECYTDEEWRDFVYDTSERDEATGTSRLMTWTEIKKAMNDVASVWRDRQADAECHRREAIGEPAKAPVETVQLVKNNPQVESALRQALKDAYGQSYLFDMHLEMTVDEAREYIHGLQHMND